MKWPEKVKVKHPSSDGSTLGLIALPLNCMLNTAGNCSYDYRSVDLGFRKTFDIDFFAATLATLVYQCSFATMRRTKFQFTPPFSHRP